MRKILTVFLLLALILPTISHSQDIYYKIRLKFDTRFDFETRVSSNKDSSTLLSIDGKYLNIILDGSINEIFSYNYRQRMILNGIDGYKSFFNAKDWVYITYKMNDNFSLSGGKDNFFADYSLISNIIYDVNRKLMIFEKAGHDENKAQQIGVISVI